MTQINKQTASVPSSTTSRAWLLVFRTTAPLSLHSFQCTGKIVTLKKPIFSITFPISVPARLLFKRCGVTVVLERMFVSDVRCKALKQALNKQHRGLCSQKWPLDLGGVTFWKNVWAQNTVPSIIWYLNVFLVPFHCESWFLSIVWTIHVVRIAFSFKSLFWDEYVQPQGELC